MQYFLTTDEMNRLISALKVAIAIPFIDDIEDYIAEAIWKYTKNIDGIDPLYNIRSKSLYDVVDEKCVSSCTESARIFYFKQRYCHIEAVWNIPPYAPVPVLFSCHMAVCSKFYKSLLTILRYFVIIILRD